MNFLTINYCVIFCFVYFYRDEDYPVARNKGNDNNLQGPPVGQNPFLDVPQNPAAIEYKKGYVMRKCCFESNNKKSKL